MEEISFSNKNELEMYKQIIEKSTVGIYVIEKSTCKLLFINDVMKKNILNQHYQGQICHQFLQGRNNICPFCVPFNHLELGVIHEIYIPTIKAYYSVKAIEIVWQGIPAFIEYIVDITEHKKLQDQFDDTGHEMETIVDNIPGGVVKMYMSGDLILPEYMSDQFCEMMNDTRENLMNMYMKNAMEGVHPDDLEHVLQVVANGMESGESFRVTYRLCNSKGEYRWVNNRSSRVHDTNGTIYYYAVYTDMDQEIKAKQQAKLASQEIELLYNSIPGAVFKCRFNKDWDIIFANDGLFRFLGYTREEFKTLFQNKMSAVIYPEDKVIMLNKILKQLKHSNTIKNENRLICKDGSIKWISIHAELLKDNLKEEYFYCTFIDITEQKNTEQELSRTKEKLIAAIIHSGLSYWEYDILNHKAFLNDTTMNEYKLPNILEDYPKSFYHSGVILPESIKAYQNLIDGVNAGKPHVAADISTITSAGKTVWKRIRFTTLFDEKKRPYWAVATAETIDELKSLEQQFSISAAQNGIETWIYDIENQTLKRTLLGDDKRRMLEIYNVPNSIIENKIIHKDDAAIARNVFKKIHEGEKNISAKLRLFHQDKEKYFYHFVSFTVLFDKNGIPISAIGTGRDISKQLELGNQYNQAIKVYRNKAKGNVLLSGWCNITKNELIEMTSQNSTDYVSMYGNNRDMFFISISKNIYEDDKRQEVLHTFLSSPLLNAYASGITTHSIECRMLIEQSYYKYVKLTIEVMEKPNTKELTGFFNMIDITDEMVYRKASSVSLLKYADFLVDVDVKLDHYTILTIRNGVKSLPPISGKYSKTHKEYEKNILGKKSLQECREKLSIKYIKEHLKSKDSYSFSYQIYQDNEVRAKKIQVFYIDKVLEHIGFIRIDITDTLSEEQKKNDALSDALNLAKQANNAKTDFLSRMSHDMRTPMNGILGLANLSLDEANIDVLHSNMKKIITSGEYLLGLINDTLDVQKLDSGNLSLNPRILYGERLFSEVIFLVNELVRQREIKFDVETDESKLDRYIYADLMRSKQILFNLLSNAIKFSPDGGKILFRCRCLSCDDKTIQEEFVVQDNGIGISQEFINNGLFKPFSQEHSDVINNNAGTGLGLSISKQLVEMMKGTIEVQSILGRGTTFTIRLTYQLVDSEIAKKEQELVVNETQQEKQSLRGKKILLAEDHPLNAEIAKKLLEKQGCIVTWVQDGKECLDTYVTSNSFYFDAILMDIRMPNLDGNNAAKAIRALKRLDAGKIPIIAMTANAFEEDRKKSIEAGMNEHLAKPINPSQLYKVLLKNISKASFDKN